MTLDDWLACPDLWVLPFELGVFPDRKLHLLTAALLRRVWDRLPSHHTRFAVEATEKFADGQISADALAWARSQAVRDSEERIWLAQGSHEDYNLIEGCGGWCPTCDSRAERYECRVAKQGGILDGARAGIETPAWVTASAAFYATELENPVFARDHSSDEFKWEWRNLFATVREVLGEDGTRARLSPEWLTFDVRALAQGIHRDQAFDRLPILADALQDAGCDDETVLTHCRRPGGHVRGCWVVDLAMGIS